jgi:hypothetical protein
MIVFFFSFNKAHASFEMLLTNSLNYKPTKVLSLLSNSNFYEAPPLAISNHSFGLLRMCTSDWATNA